MYISPEYKLLLEETHAEAPWGTKGYKYFAVVAAFCDSIGPDLSVLDYGSGSETLREAFAEVRPEVDFRCYDPGVPARAALPEHADVVACTDVLEHIEPEFLDNVLVHIDGLARRGVFLHIATKLAKRHLADGRNAHLIVKPAAWWIEKLSPFGGSQGSFIGSKSVRIWIVK